MHVYVCTGKQTDISHLVWDFIYILMGSKFKSVVKHRSKSDNPNSVNIVIKNLDKLKLHTCLMQEIKTDILISVKNSRDWIYGKHVYYIFALSSIIIAIAAKDLNHITFTPRFH